MEARSDGASCCSENSSSAGARLFGIEGTISCSCGVLQAAAGPHPLTLHQRMEASVALCCLLLDLYHDARPLRNVLKKRLHVCICVCVCELTLCCTYSALERPSLTLLQTEATDFIYLFILWKLPLFLPGCHRGNPTTPPHPVYASVLGSQTSRRADCVLYIEDGVDPTVSPAVCLIFSQ